VLWLFVLAGGTGLLLGLWLRRVVLVLVASGLFAVPAIVAMTLAQWPLLTAVAYAYALIGTLQLGYLAGLMLARAGSRAQARDLLSPE
jgi:hypothetical protein